MALMYCELNGDNWLEGELWVSQLHECDWYSMIGVDPCSRNEQYQILRSYGEQMQGTLPPEISMLSSLWEISLSDNLISGTIPPDFAKLSLLDTVSLSFNLFKGTIPDFMFQYPDMAYLDLAYNFFTGTIPNGVYETSPNMQVLLVENNDLAGTIPVDFGNLNWKRLHLDGNHFKGTIPPNLGAPNMEELLLHDNKLSGTFPTQGFVVTTTPQNSPLKDITIYNNDITGDIDALCQPVRRDLTIMVDPAKVTCSCCLSGA